MAFASLMKGHCEDAVNGFNGVLQLQPNHVQSHGNLGLAYAALGDRDSALWHLNRAIELDPHYLPAIDNRRVVLELQASERLQFGQMREVDFYADKVWGSSHESLGRNEVQILRRS
jgi:lipoprotein NlpI